MLGIRTVSKTSKVLVFKESIFQRVGKRKKRNQIIFSIVISGNEIESKGTRCSYGGERVWDESVEMGMTLQIAWVLFELRPES